MHAVRQVQQYLRGLRERGILLAVSSKNETANARLPFEEHPETVLKLSDFAAFRASWDPKADNIRAMAADLDLGHVCCSLLSGSGSWGPRRSS